MRRFGNLIEKESKLEIKSPKQRSPLEFVQAKNSAKRRFTFFIFSLKSKSLKYFLFTSNAQNSEHLIVWDTSNGNIIEGALFDAQPKIHIKESKYWRYFFQK